MSRNKIYKANKWERENVYQNLDLKNASNKYDSITNVSEDEQTISIRTSNLFKTRYGYGLMVGNNKVVWLKDFNVCEHDWYDYTVAVLIKKYFTVKDYDFKSKDIRTVDGDATSNFTFDAENTWESLVEIAKEQANFGNED